MDFNAVLGRVRGRTIAYAVCYLESDRKRDDLWLQVGSDDQAKVYINGREIYQFPQPRPLDSLDTVPVTLKQGPGGSLTFAPANLTVTQGQVVTVKNVGVAPHTFTVTGQSINVTNAIGQSQKVTVNLPPGTYPFVCTFHQAQGMTGTLVVT